MIKNKRTELILINVVYLLVLAAVSFPLLYIGKYNFPSADDWSYGQYGFQALKDGGNLLDLISAVSKTVKAAYLEWDGRFGGNIFLAMQPGIFGEQYYVIVPYLMIGITVLSQICLCSVLLNIGSFRNRGLAVPIAAPFLMIELLFVPWPVQTFYWYAGALNYTFMTGLAVLSFALFFRLTRENGKGVKRFLKSLLLVLLLFLVGGGNYSTSLASVLTAVLLSTYYLIKDRTRLKRVWFAAPAAFGGLVVSLSAPGRMATYDNTDKINGNGLFETIIKSLFNTFTNIISWTNTEVILAILIALPFMITALKNIDFEFKKPAVCTILSFGIYASMIAPNLYVLGTNGSERTGDIAYYVYVMWIAANVFYWTGWARLKISEKIKNGGRRLFRFGVIPYCAVLGIAYVGRIYFFDLKETSSYNAYRDIRQGWAKQYAEEWKNRFEVLNDDNVKEAEFKPLSVQPVTIFYADLQPSDGFWWINSACESYYGKTKITVVTENGQDGRE